MRIAVDALCAGKAATLPSGRRSGIAKHASTGRVAIGLRGIAEDQQVDRRFHGYPPMALHHFPFEHYAWLQHHFGDLPRLAERGSMGENISTRGLTEHDVCIGDRFRFGGALLEVSQPRQPCATIEHHLEAKGVVKAMVAAARSGWFYRVIEAGHASAEDPLELAERIHPQWPVARVFLAVYGARGTTPGDLRAIASLDRVSERLVHDIAKRLPR